MRVFDNSVNTLQEQTFTYERLVQYRNGDPYVIPAGYNNPYIVFSLGSSKYEKNVKLFKSWWGLVDDSFPRFEVVEPEVLTEEPLDKGIYFPEGWDRENSNRLFKWDGEDTLELTKGEYFYYKKVVSEEVTSYEIVPYEFRYIRVFSYDDLEKLQGFNYVYDIKVVSGETNYEALVELLHFYGIDQLSWEIKMGEVSYTFALDPNGVWRYNGDIPSFEVLKEFAKSDVVKEFVLAEGEEELKQYREYLKAIKADHFILRPENVDFILKPTPFNISSVVKGRAYEN